MEAAAGERTRQLVYQVRVRLYKGAAAWCVLYCFEVGSLTLRYRGGVLSAASDLVAQPQSHAYSTSITPTNRSVSLRIGCSCRCCWMHLRTKLGRSRLQRCSKGWQVCPLLLLMWVRWGHGALGRCVSLAVTAQPVLRCSSANPTSPYSLPPHIQKLTPPTVLSSAKSLALHSPTERRRYSEFLTRLAIHARSLAGGCQVGQVTSILYGMAALDIRDQQLTAALTDAIGPALARGAAAAAAATALTPSAAAAAAAAEADDDGCPVGGAVLSAAEAASLLWGLGTLGWRPDDEEWLDNLAACCYPLLVE